MKNGTTQSRPFGLRGRRLLAGGVILVTLCSASAAGAESLYARMTRDRWFVGVGGALGVSNFDDYDAGDVTGGVTFRVGKKPIPSFAWEIESDYFVKFEDGNARPLLATANARWMIPPRWIFPAGIDEAGRWQPFLLGGAGWMQARSSQDGNFEQLDSAVFRAGLGVELYTEIDMAWRLDAQYMIPVGDGDEFQFAALLITLQIY